MGLGYEYFIGLRYLRAKRTNRFVNLITVISIVGITVGVTALIIVISVMSGFQSNIKDKLLGIDAHIVVGASFGRGIKDHKDLMENLKEIPGVVGATPFIYGKAMVSTKSGVNGVSLRGIDVDTIGDVTILKDSLVDGSFKGLEKGFDKSGDLPGIVIGEELADTVFASVGDEINIISPSVTSNIPRVAAFKVVGIFKVGMYDYDMSMAFISLDSASKFLKLKDAVSVIALKVDDIYNADSISNDIEYKTGNMYFTRTWQELNSNLFYALKQEKVIMFIILSLIIMVAALNIISTLIMVVMEKSKDIAILKSMGATSSSIMKIFMTEGFIIGLVGTFSGGLLGTVVAVNLASFVDFLESEFGIVVFPSDVYYLDGFPCKVEPTAVLIILASSLLISFLATIYPSKRAAALDPVDGLRYE